MKRSTLIVLLLALAVPCLAFGPATPHPATRPTNAPQAQTATPVRAAGELPKGYVTIDGGPGTMCSQGTPYAFYFRPGNPDKLLITFGGGGACWTYHNCDLTQKPTYNPTVGSETDPQLAGILDPANAENPFADHSVLVVPYCTGDVHLGNKTVTYPAPASDKAGGNSASAGVQIHHNGYNNATAALRWVYSRIASPREVFVAGTSAGAIASAFYVDRVAEHYKTARIGQLGDSAGAYRAAIVPKLLEGWGATDMMRRFPSYVQQDASKVNFETLYIAAARNHPGVTLAQFNTTEDETQVFFLDAVGVPNALLPPLLEQNFRDIRAASPGFRSYTAPGTFHTILGEPVFYSMQVSGVRLRDWVANLAAGRPVENVSPGKAK